ncbi:hypothetical protein Hypma_008095 [Hypsizygus marmoreus]|uniref:Uncharacterized protein n=1 Tax=Hypsizygus marmoreus TaxID=39966 RepID=A0A369JZH9_HYPMA|nr:hypothetical protein Hypma_008095 [Hypsizygus marmoreus]
MASLSDQIDRLSRNTRAIRSTVANTARVLDDTLVVAGPFTRAVLNTPLGDLIRDIDPSELGLFTLQSKPQDTAASHEVTRAEFSGATPLRKPPPRRDDASKSKEIEPETYAEAALKCIDRYQAIRPMPRAHSQVVAILERLDAVRENIQALHEVLQQTQPVEDLPLRSLIDDEDKRVHALQARLSHLKKRKQDALSQHKAPQKKVPTHSRPTSKPRAPPPPISPHEDKFWNTPAAAARTLRFTDNLMDEQVDLGDITTTSFMSPLPPSPSTRSRPGSSRRLLDTTPEDLTFQDTRRTLDESVLAQKDEHRQEYEDDLEQGREEEETVVLKRLLPVSGTPEPSASPSAPRSDEQSIADASVPVHTKLPKVKVNSDVERITAKIWATVGDIIMPGHPFDPSDAGINSKPPRAKETIAHLQSLSALTPSPSSPSASSISSASAPGPPTSQQILTAHLLLSLLTSPPHFSMPLNKTKDLLAAKASGGGSIVSAGQGTTRILYGCVAKRLVKIERGGGEQIVKFDI